MGFWHNSAWHWNFKWRRPLFIWEAEEVKSLVECILLFIPKFDSQDKWSWIPNSNDDFSVKRAYSWLQGLSLVISGHNSVSKAFQNLWGSAIPPKVRICIWRLFLSRIPTRSALADRGILQPYQDLSCVFCSADRETCLHLFFTCNKSVAIWNSIFHWMGFSYVLHRDPISNYNHFGLLLRRKCPKQYKFLIWSSVIWVIWINRNKIVFQGAAFNSESIIHLIKLLSWSWLGMKKGSTTAIRFLDWENNPISCLLQFQCKGPSAPESSPH